jgi:hypothetical protein
MGWNDTDKATPLADITELKSLEGLEWVDASSSLEANAVTLSWLACNSNRADLRGTTSPLNGPLKLAEINSIFASHGLPRVEYDGSVPQGVVRLVSGDGTKAAILEVGQ